MDRGLLAQLQHLLRPLATRIANIAARGVVQLVDDAKKLQLLQIGVLADEDGDDAEHHQPYGFSSVPLAGAEAIVLYPNGDRSHPLVVTVSDRRHRPTGGEPGEVAMYHHGGARVTMLNNGNVLVRAAPGAEVLVDDGAGGASAIPTMADFNGLVEIMSNAGVGSATALPATLLSYQGAHPTWPVGTAVLKAK